ncbi:carboxypeptidase-like regulatory domain-containing protein [Myxococcota bacterium]|nr:carboxypeptidase-like regulatory domain-containing protein [Myxococcota bacterium]MBU1432003.1 carboxypeptidase-like regulatory domain-containing protein [Myxococcota bacterium]MBU1896179.1 carboxypeptidase-like regulatory domain-containing protein [Myxococcota bacterium]
MRAHRLILMAFIWGCNSNGGGGLGDGGLDPSLIEGLVPIEIITQLRGRVSDLEGAPLEGVTVTSTRANGGPSVTTRASGRYALNLSPGEHALRFTREGYMTQVKRVSVIKDMPTVLDATLRPEAPPRPLDVSAGGVVIGARGAGINAPAGAFAAPDGALATGEVEVRITPIDPSVSAELLTVSGDFKGEQASGALTLLKSFGMIEVSVRQGETPLQVAEGQTVEIRIPAPANITDPPETMPLWGFDEIESRWVEEGIATYDPTDKVYVGQVSHFSPHNADEPQPAYCISGHILDRVGRPVGGARVVIEVIGGNSSSEVTSGADGRFIAATPPNAQLKVKAYHREVGAHTREVSSGSEFVGPFPFTTNSECDDVGEWTVERDVFRGADGTEVICGDANPLIGTCAAGFIDQIGGCFRPAGECTIELDGTITWRNGVSLEMSVSTSGFEVIYFGNEGATCGWIEVEGSLDQGISGYTFSLPGGESYDINLDRGLQQMLIGCPGGETFIASEAQREAIEACSAQIDDSDCGLDDIELRFEGMDEGDPCVTGECKAGLQCCFTTDIGLSEAGVCIKDSAPCVSL